MKILLSPAKNIDITKRLEIDVTSCSAFIEEAGILIKKLQKYSPKKIAGMMHISPELADLNVQRFNDWDSTIELKENKGHSIAIFNGEVYRGLDALTMNKNVLERAQESLRILSGIYGILKPLDVISPYRLEMGTAWAVTPAKKNLYKFWGNKITNFLNEEEQKMIVNLASTEYSKVIDFKKLKAEVVTPVFKEIKNGKATVVMVYAKQARGKMARYILDNDLHTKEELMTFDLDGYLYDKNLSNGNEIVFTR